MKIQVDKIGPGGLDLDEEVSAAWLDASIGKESFFLAAAAGRVRAHLDRADKAVHVRGEAQLQLTGTCSRCLEPLTLPLQAKVEVTLFPRGAEPASGPDGELSQEDAGVSTYENKEIDLSTVVRDEVLLALPMSPLCSDNCAGLCPRCGANLNEGACPCQPEIDSRWGPLRKTKREA